MKKVSKSFTTGAIALVFAVLGYQTALLVHYAAVARIVSNTDRPDTVFVALDSSCGMCPAGVCPPADRSSGRGPSRAMGGSEAVGRSPGRAHAAGRNAAINGGSSHEKIVSRNGYHSDAARRIRDAAVGRRVETFRFNPNTVTLEDLQRLGFSEKQAASIDSYRRKGGHFRRKEDFSSSYVVSDSVYRRLEPYIDIPRLDINKADSAAFDALPGIGPYFATRMVEYRRQLGGYSYPEQLLEIYHFDEQKYEALKDLIEVGECRPFRLWALPADSLRLHPYIRNASVARGIVMYRTHNPVEKWTVEGLELSGVINRDCAEKLKKCIVAAP